MDSDLSLRMLGMHGTVCANYAVHHSDLLLGFGVRFDDRVTGKLETFAARATIVHVDIDPAEIHKNKEAHVPICADTKQTLDMLLSMLYDHPIDAKQFAEWRSEIAQEKEKFPMSFDTNSDMIMPQQAIQVTQIAAG